MSEAIDKLAARRRRIARIRGSVVAVSLAIFIALFAGLYVQMAAGRDPVLGSQTVATSSAGSSTSSDSTDASTADTTTADTTTSTDTSTATAVTTSQS